MRIVLAQIFVLLICSAPAHSQQTGEYAAVAANNEGNLQIRKGKTEAEAKQRAVEACRSVSNTCSGNPASTNLLDDVFAYMCCNTPSFSCANPSHETREKATEEANTLMRSRGYSDCSVRAFFSARTGRQL